MSAIAEDAGTEPARVVCALRPGALSGDSVLGVLTRLRVKGFGLCLDDFGASQAPGDQVSRIPLTATRLAADLVAQAAAGPARRVLREAIEVSRSLALPVVGGGCRTAEDFDLLPQLGCTHAQGGFIADPLTAAEFAAWAANWTPAPADSAAR